LLSKEEVLHCNWHSKAISVITSYLPNHQPVKILITSGASCPDAVVESVIEKLVSFYNTSKTVANIIDELVA